MESLSRPPHRRKHSTTTANIFSASSFSFKNPYDGVLLPDGGGRKSFGVNDYSEIFAGSSSIPVLDLPGLDERVGSDDSRNPKLDYSDIFGGLRNDDGFVPYEELLNGSAKKTKPRILAEAGPDLQGSGSLHSSRKPKRSSSEASDQSVGGVKQQFNMSFNRTNQRNSDASDGKTHVAQIHAVPGFTHFVDGTPRLHKTKDDKLPTLKREVSRTWSFSAEVEPVKDRGGSSSEKSETPGKSHNLNEVNLKSQFLKVPPPSSCPSNLSSNKDPRQTRVSNFASKEDASRKITGGCSPPFIGEEFDENLVDSVSAAALKKAIDQAQESIRIAKIIMERKKEGYQDGSKPRPISRLKVLDKETKIDHEAYGSKDNDAMEKNEKLDPVFAVLTGIDGKFPPSLSHNGTIINPANSQVERVMENIEADKGHGEAFAGESKLFASTCSQNEARHIDENVKLEKLEKHDEEDDAHAEAKDFPGLVDNAVCRTGDLEPGKVGNINNLMPSTCILAFNIGGLEAGKENFEQRKVTDYNTEESEVVPELVERANNASQGAQGMEKSVEEEELCQPTFDQAKEPENMVERVLNISQRTPEHDEVVNEADENLNINHESGVNKQLENDTNDKEKLGKKLENHQEMLNVENLGLRSEFNNAAGNESLDQVEMEKKSENVSEWKENDHRHGKTYDAEISGMKQKDAHLWPGSKGQLKEALLEEINEREPDVIREIGEVEEKVGEAYEPEIDKTKQNHADDGGESKLPKELMQNKFEEKLANPTEYVAVGTETMEANHFAKVQEGADFCDAEDTDNTPRDAGRSEGNYSECQFQEAAYEHDIDEAADLSRGDASTIFDEAHTNGTSTIIHEAQEACGVDLNNKAEEHHKPDENYEENDSVPEVNETISAIDNDKKAEQLFDLPDNEMLGTDSLHRSASEEIFVENKLNDDFEGLSSDGKVETVGITDDPEENLPEDEDVFKATCDIHDAAQEYAAKINGDNLREVLASDTITAEFDLTDVRQVLEQTSDSDGGSLSTSSSEKMDGLSAHEPEDCAESVKDKASNKEELNDEMISDERKCVEEPSEGSYSELYSEPKEMDKPIETERAAERGLNLEKNKENLGGTSPMEERDAKEGVQNFENNDQQQRMEAIKRGREREKDRIAVERAIREARERAFAEARERAERAAVERAAAEAQQRVMAEPREKVEKASAVKQPVDKASTGAKLRAERAAVERATAEARERALEKAMSQKISGEARAPADSSRNSRLKHSFSSSDLENGMSTESAQRRKARLERHQRIMERAAKALAEKNMRDLLAQKEQAERNRLAESLDADIKRWATGKEGNLRALLSTLQYILGPDSGWQPIPLTEIITTVAVKKAYRKATLYVHPDKLQQRGASVQQKYICEKVFDLLKAAWNRFNSDER